MVERPITHLRYVALGVPDLATQASFFQNEWGLTRVSDDTGVVHFAAEGSPEPFIVRIRQAAERRVDLISFGAKDGATVDALAEDLIAAGVSIVREPGTLDSPSGGYGVRFFDLDGRTIEVSSDVTHRQHRKIEERESIPVRLSHVVVNTTDPTATKDWYERFLGFSLSDSLGDHMHFMRCSPLHHSFAIARSGYHSLNHVSFEMRGLDEYMRGTGRLLRAGTTMLWGPGRHLAGDNTFSYFLDPHGNTVEYTTALEEIDEDTWHPHVYDLGQPEVQDQWGTAGAIDDIVNNGKFATRDPGLFVAPPI
jgi:catechol 2,3-dioxygenase-like lactoylglutathione lyase family enzyme/predicted lactoylglutathione lyase